MRGTGYSYHLAVGWHIDRLTPCVVVNVYVVEVSNF